MNEDWTTMKPNWAGVEPVPARLPVPGGSVPQFERAAIDGEVRGSAPARQLSDEAQGSVLPVFCLYAESDNSQPRFAMAKIMLQGEPEKL